MIYHLSSLVARRWNGFNERSTHACL